MMMLDMAGFSKTDWRPPIIRVESVFQPDKFKEQVGQVSEAIQRHYAHLLEKGLLGSRIRRKTIHELNEALRACILEPILNRLVADGELEKMADRCLKKESDPYSCAEEIAGRCLKEFS